MPYVYKYTDLQDGTVKYVGIIRTDSNFPMRFIQHKSDRWHKTSYWHIEYFEVETITDAEAIEGHLIWLYGTGEYYNKAKTTWGKCTFIPEADLLWSTYIKEDASEMEERSRQLAQIIPEPRKIEKDAISTVADVLREYTGKGTIRASEVAGFLGDSNVSRVKAKYLSGLEAIGGRAYLITDVAERLKEHCVMK